MPTGRVSWFGGPHDSSDSGHTYNGGTTATPGVAIYNRATINGYWKVKFPNGRVVILKQTDLGPHPTTGRKVDVTYSALRQAGYTEHNFPTDANVQYSYLGKNPPRGGTAPQQVAKPGGTTRITKTVTPGVDNSALRNQLKFNYLSKTPASPFSAQALTPAKPLTDPLKALSAPPSAPDPVKYLGQANAKTSALLSLAGNLQGAQDVAPVTKTVTQVTPGAPAAKGGGGGGNNLVFRGVQFRPGIVGIGKALQKLGLKVSENPHFGGVLGHDHHGYGYYDHYHGGAIDVNGPSWLLNTVANFLAHHKAQLGIPTSGAPNLGGHRGTGVLYQVPDHYDHLHVSARH